MWSKNSSYPAPVGRPDATYIADAVNTGGQPLLAQQYEVTVTQFDYARTVSLWLCYKGTWSASTCSGTIEQVGTSQDVTSNGTYRISTADSVNPSHFTIPVGGRLSLLLTNDRKGHTVPQYVESLGVLVSRSMSVRAGTESDL